jgi:hypothetical protein
VSTQNLRLAWKRINTGRNLQYKRFYRDLYLVYEGAAGENIRELHSRLIARAWKPTYARRVHLPKPSGLQRPLSLLGVEDQILLQAIANVFAKKLRKKRQRVELETVFSNKLSDSKGSIFFTERWQTTYRAFQEKCIKFFTEGYRWAAHFDLSAFYDTISHDLLVSIISPRSLYPNTWNIVKEWLRIWSAGDKTAMTGHGIPQGPIASDFLAEAFFLPIDIKLHKERSPYIRYVDDIRLFGRTENEVRQAAIVLEQECRHRGLIPQSKKFEIRELRSSEDAMGALPSIPPSDPKASGEEEMTAIEARTMLKSALAGRPLKIKDKSRFRYVMYRAPADNKLLTSVLRLLPRHPEHIDTFVAYFANYSRRRRIAKDALSYLITGLPYSYVRGELWHVVARLGGFDELSAGLPLAREDAKKRSGCVVLSWGVMHFLIRCEAEGLARLGRRLSSECPMSRALLAPVFPDREFARGGHTAKLLKGTLEEQLAGAREMQKRGVTLGALGIRQRNLTPVCRNVLRALGVIRRRHRSEADWISDRLVTLYGCSGTRIWRALLNTEYEHASQILAEAEARFHGAYSEWLALQDSFNDISVSQFFTFLRTMGLPGHSQTVGRGGCLFKYGSLIAQGSPFDLHYGDVANWLRQFHQRRNQIPGSHPYDERGGTRNRWLTREERDALVPGLRESLDGITGAVHGNRM